MPPARIKDAFLHNFANELAAIVAKISLLVPRVAPERQRLFLPTTAF
jgi:hypothetical protein